MHDLVESARVGQLGGSLRADATSSSPPPPIAVIDRRHWTIVGKHLWCNGERCRPSAQMHAAKGMGCLECEGCDSGCEVPANRTAPHRLKSIGHRV
eukprot:7389320-Prymnesium_polylepis.2